MVATGEKRLSNALSPFQAQYMLKTITVSASPGCDGTASPQQISGVIFHLCF